jgi:hypothetical protein
MCRVIIYGILFLVFDYEHTFDIILMTLSHVDSGTPKTNSLGLLLWFAFASATVA